MEEVVEVVVGLGHPGQREVVQEETGRQETQVWGLCEGQSLG